MNDPNSEEVAEEVSAQESNVAPQPRNSSLSPQISASVQFTGPIPHPGILEQYNRILPSAADRIISMAERRKSIDTKCRKNL